MANFTTWTLAALATVLLCGIKGVSGTFGHLPNISEAVHDVQEDVQNVHDLFHGTQQTNPCSTHALGLSAGWAASNPFGFPKTSCAIQAALGLVKQPAAPASKLDRLEAILHTNTQTVPPQISTGAFGPAYAFDLIRNATSGGPFNVNPQIPPFVLPGGRRLAETAGAKPLDSVVTTGSETVYQPTNGTIDGNNFYTSFLYAYINPAINKFSVPTGTYRVVNTIGNFNLFALCYAVVRTPFELDFGGSTIIFTDGEKGGIFFGNCYNLTAHNATFYYDFSVNPWYQSTLDDISPDGTTWNITVQDGYPTYYIMDNYQALCVGWDPNTRLPRSNASDIYPMTGKTTSLGGRSYQFKFGYSVVGFNKGDFITCRGDRGNHGILPWYSQDSTFRDFTIYNAAIFGIYEETGKRNIYINNKVVPYPFPVGSGGAREAPLQSSLADGFHSSGSFTGPTLIGNTFTNMGDDGIAIHGHFYLVVGVDKPQGVITVATLCGYPCDRLYPGNSLLAYKPTTERLGFTRMLSITSLPGSPLPSGTKSTTFPNANLDQSTYVNITIDCWPPAYDNLTFDSIVTSLDNQGNGFNLINNTIAYNRGRGTLLKGNNGVLRGNQFIQPKFVAAQITPEFFFQEADFSSNLVIDSNVFDSYYGGIQLAFINDGTLLPGQFQNHVNINITNNIIRNAADQPLLITSSTAVIVSGNTFDSVLCYPFTYGAALPFVPTPQPPVFLAYSSNLLFSGNSYNIPPNCTYGDFANPIQTYQGTVTGLVIQ